MEHYEERIIPSRKERFITGTTCDMCGEKLVERVYIHDKVEIEYDLGDRYPDGASGTKTKIDMCPKCFKGKLLPWIKSQGGSYREEEYIR